MTITDSSVNVAANGGIYADSRMTIDNSTVIIDGGTSGARATATFIYDSTVKISGEIAIVTNTMYGGDVFLTNSNLEISAQEYAIHDLYYNKPLDGYSLYGYTGHVIYAGEDKESATIFTAQDGIFDNKYLRFAPAIKVTANYGVDGVDNKEFKIEKGTTLSLENPEIDGYAFIGWYNEETLETASVNPDDYFDVFSYHPYIWSSKPINEEYFIEESHKLYQVILDNEQKHKKVYITEVGFSEYGRGQEVVGESIRRMFHAISTAMPYVETLNYFKLYDIATNAWAGASGDNGMERYGLFYDFNPERPYYMLNTSKPSTHTDTLCVPGAPKSYAYLFQELAGGKGDLTLMANYYANKNKE